MNETEVKEVVQQIINEVGATTMKDMGRVMGMVTKQLAGKADNSLVSKIARDLLGN